MPGKKFGVTILSLFVISIFILSTLAAQDTGMSQVIKNTKWQQGPCNVNLGDVAELRIPLGYIFAGASDTAKIMDAMGNIPSKNELGLFAPGSFEWFVIYEFSAVGYVKDDEKNSLDADALLKNIQNATEQANKIRKKRGIPILQNISWFLQPHYDELSHNLEWAIRGEEEKGGPVINQNTRFLGRKGIMVVTLVTDPSNITSVLADFKTSLKGFNFRAGNTYAEFRQGDKLAGYGLTALVAGGAAAVAVKTGLFKYLWKFIIFIFAGIAAFFKKVWTAIKNAIRPKDKMYR